MTPRDFVYFLQGFFEISNASSLDAHEVEIIKDHLKLVFQKETPDRSVNVSFLGVQREIFDEKYIKEALGIDVDLEMDRMNKEGYTYVEYPLSPDHSFPTLFDMENNVPVSC